MSMLTMKKIGTKKFGPQIDITDPCYDRDVWCRVNDVKIKEGEYTCVIWKNKKNDVCRIGIYLDGHIPSSVEMDDLSWIGVDAGLAGFFNHKPDYTSEEWYGICDSIKGKDSIITEDGFFSNSGDGDGEYPVYTFRNDNDEIVAVEICFK